MSAPVDVLAVMELTAEQARTLRGLAQDTGAFRVNNGQATAIASACSAALQMAEARAAVAELIEADREFDAARDAFYATARDGETAHERYMRQGRYIRAGKRRAAALARCGGAP